MQTDKSFLEVKGFVKTLLDEIAAVKANSKAKVSQWVRNMNVHFHSAERCLDCPICRKLTHKVYLSRHGEACLMTKQTAG